MGARSDYRNEGEMSRKATGLVVCVLGQDGAKQGWLVGCVV